MMHPSETDDSWLTLLPKVELHLHLEGSIPHPAFWELLQKYGGDPAVPTQQALGRKFVYRDFPHFIETWSWMNGFLREYDDFQFIAEQVAGDLARQNIRYAEVFFSPADFLPAGLEPQRLTEAIRSGLDRVCDVEVALVADLVRDYGPKRGSWTLACVNEVRSLGVIGIGIGGGEHKVPPEAFAEVFERARTLGFKTTAHAGEAAGPESVWGAIRSLRVDRIGHATRAIEDPQLVNYLAEKKIALELCVLSNVHTAVIPEVASHPARIYYDRGIPLSINTDDPSLFGNSLAEEYLALHKYLGFTRSDILRLMEQAIETSWLSAERKRDLRATFRNEFHRPPGTDAGSDQVKLGVAYHLVHANVAIARAPLDHPMMAGFVSQVDEINALAAQSPGFVAQPTPVDQGEVFNGRALINLSIWESVEGLNRFTHDGQHAVALKRRAEWFEQDDRTSYVLYWAPIGHFPTEAEVKQQLDHLKQHGPTPLAFSFEQQFTVEEMLAIASEPVRP